MPAHRARRMTVTMMMTATMAALSGCGGAGGFGESVQLPQETRVTLQAQFAEGKPLYFPKDRPFNVFDAQRSSTGGATAKSWSTEGGTALCEASAESVGTARAEFQLGQVIDTRAEEPLDVTAVFDLNYEYSVKVDAEDTSKPQDKLAVKVYISDSDGHVLKRVLLADLGTATGPKRFSGREKPSFDVTLEPGLVYHFVVAGLVEVEATETSTASARIDIRSLELELLPRATHR
ncbi:MAG: hypothetical protein JSV19_14030 [Phycisphaerales bacterium]|nr:MAG: hypothetical protein JSV19_14030 [Phycisphaerales bacterium]